MVVVAILILINVDVFNSVHIAEFYFETKDFYKDYSLV